MNSFDKQQEKTQKLFEKNFVKWGFDMNVLVSLLSAIFVIIFITFTLLKPSLAASTFANINAFINEHFSWIYILTVNASVISLLVMGLSKRGKIRLGGFNAKPEFSNFAWYSMLFSAGIGIGIFFYGVAEPLYYLNIPDALNTESNFDNFKMMYLHWGIHAWALYGLIATGLGYFTYNKGLPFSLRSLFFPIIGDKIYGYIGDIIDTVAVLGVLFGLGTSLGLGAQQINSGLNYVFGIEISGKVQAILIFFITVIAIFSVVTGVKKGVKFLSEANIFISGAFLLVILLVGPTVYIIATYFSSMGIYLREFVNISLWTATTESDISWQASWTIFYWAWCVSWTPFVGAFIAKISKGRTIREIAVGTIVLPTILTTIAMTILGASGIYVNEVSNGLMTAAIESNIATSMFEMLKNLIANDLFKNIMYCTGIISIVLFFVTSSDSGSLIVDSLASGGKENTPKTQRTFWASSIGLVALSVLLMGGKTALKTLQSAVIITAFPFSILLLIIIFSLNKELNESYKKYQYNSHIRLKKRLAKISIDEKYKR